MTAPTILHALSSLRSMDFIHASSGVSPILPIGVAPALFTRMSTRPSASCARAIATSSCAASVRSAGTATQRALGSRAISAAAAASRAASRATMATATPSCASSRAIARPMPSEPPVTTAAFPQSPSSIRRARGIK